MTAPPAVTPMVNPIRPYDWGSGSALAVLQGREPPGTPEAELWMGAHAGDPSRLVVEEGTVPLPAAIAGAPGAVLGPAVRAAFGDRLPFLFKVLAIARPLSVQVHPTRERARAVFGRPGSPYQDDNHKPELLYALEPTQALFGFRPAAEVLSLLSRLGAARLAPLLAELEEERDGDDAGRLRAALRTLITWPVDDRAALVAEVVAGAASGASGASGFRWVVRLAELHPTDPMVLAPLLLDLLELAPGETVYVPAGVPHCYLDGLGIEIMANSDNVLRCGLTSKEIAVEELLEIVDCRPRVAPAATVTASGPELTWRVPAPDFALGRIDVEDEVELGTLAGPQVVLCATGSVTVSASGAEVTVTPGTSAFVTAAAGQVTLTGSGRAFRATAG